MLVNALQALGQSEVLHAVESFEFKDWHMPYVVPAASMQVLFEKLQSVRLVKPLKSPEEINSS